MKFFKKLSITHKYLAIFILVPTIFTFLLCIITITLYQESLTEIVGLESRLYNNYIEKRTWEKVDFLSRIGSDYLKNKNREELDLLGEFIVDNPEVEYVALMNKDNEVIFSKGKMDSNDNIKTYPKLIRDKDGNYLGSVVILVTRKRVNVIIGEDKEAIYRSINKILIILILVFIFCNIGIITTGSLLLKETLLTPLRTLIRAARTITTGNLDTRLQNVPEDEIGELATAFNSMTESLRKRESELRESRDFLHQVFRAAADYGIVTSDLNRNIILFSQGAEQILGWEEKEILNDSLDKIFGENKELNMGEILKKLNKGQRGFDGEILLTRKNGKTFPAHLSMYPVLGESGAIVSYLALFQDISARKELEAKLSESEYNYRMLVENSYSMVYLIQDGVMKYVNPALCRTFGYTEDEAIGKPVMDLISPSHRDLVRENIRRRVDGETEAMLYDFLALKKDGSTFDMEVNGVRIIYHGKPAVQGTAIDITQRKQYEKEILEANLRMQSVLDSTIDYAIISTDKDGIIEIFNKGAENLFGYQPDEIVGKKTLIPLLAKGEIDGKDNECFYSISDPENPVEREFDFARKDGTQFIGVLSLTRRFDSSGNYTGLQVIIKDVTQQKKMQEELKNYSVNLENLVEERTKELKKTQEELVRKEKLAVLGQLTGTVSHELRNPLAVMRSSTYYLKGKMSEDDQKIAKHLDRIERQIQICDSIIGELLEFTRAWIPRLSESSINSLINFTLTEMQIPENVKVEKNYEQGLPILNLDPGKIQQVIINLVNNAIQSMEKGGKLTIKTHREDPEWVVIEVGDEGEGISPENLDKIFEPLFTTRARGVGLGLSIVSKIIEAHEGKIRAISKKGEGTIIEIKLPQSNESGI